MSKLPTGAANDKVSKAIDWERIETDYRAGLLSVREIASAQGVSHQAIQKRAKRDKWERDLKAKIQSKADALVANHAVATLVASDKKATELATIEANAKVISDIRIKHRTFITQLNETAMTMMVQLQAETGQPELFEKLGELLIDTADENSKEYQAKRVEALNKALSLTNRINNLKVLTETIKMLVALECQAYGIGELPPAEKPVEQKETGNTYDAEYWVEYQNHITAKLGISHRH